MGKKDLKHCKDCAAELAHCCNNHGYHGV